MTIKVTEFAKRHFDGKTSGTKITNISAEKFDSYLKEILSDYENDLGIDDIDYTIEFIDGYAPFCKLAFVKNFTNAKSGSMPITLENYQYIRSGYAARREGELPVFSRWLELPYPMQSPKAEYLCLVLYSKEQIDKEGRITLGNDSCADDKYEPFDGDLGIVAILGQMNKYEEPMQPATMIRNALGIEEGGSGFPLDRKKYLESVEFWDKNIIIK